MVSELKEQISVIKSEKVVVREVERRPKAARSPPKQEVKVEINVNYEAQIAELKKQIANKEASDVFNKKIMANLKVQNEHLRAQIDDDKSLQQSFKAKIKEL